MEKTTKKRKKSKRLKKRIGLIAIGGLSLVLTVCLSVGATLAWFAGSTWASNEMYMGGPVYVEMAGRGVAGESDNTDKTAGAIWKGGAGTLDIVASKRSTGTAGYNEDTGSTNILLPGQKLLIYSQARVFSTLETSSVTSGEYADQSSGTSNSNISDGTKKYYNGYGSVQTATTSVLRAKFSINIEFDPAMGFNGLTDDKYVEGYPVQSSPYIGEVGTTGATPDAGTGIPGVGEEGDDDYQEEVPAVYGWAGALGATPYSIEREVTGTAPDTEGTIKTVTGRRDAVENNTVVWADPNDDESNADDVKYWVNAADGTNDLYELMAIKDGKAKSIYKWKYVSKAQYWADSAASQRMGKPFDGTVNTAGNPSSEGFLNGTSGPKGTGNGYYGLWVLEDGEKAESDAFYKARTESYLDSYREHYVDEYNRDLVLELGSSLQELEDSLNKAFINLISQSSDAIQDGKVKGFNADDDGSITDRAETTGINASWLYVDPSIGNDTNASDSSSSVGGWWYLVSSEGSVVDNTNAVNTVVDHVDGVTSIDYNENSKTFGNVKYNYNAQVTGSKNVPGAAETTYATATTDPDGDPIVGEEGSNPLVAKQILSNTFTRADVTSAENGSSLTSKDPRILNAKLYEITPNIDDVTKSRNPANGVTTTKVVSVAFPFVNGNFELPTKALTNKFANAKISFQITFQALQAFFPFANSIDGLASGSALAGTGKALNIGNAIPIYNEAFDYLSYLDVADYRP